jgi:hypothetical protein
MRHLGHAISKDASTQIRTAQVTLVGQIFTDFDGTAPAIRDVLSRFAVKKPSLARLPLARDWHDRIRGDKARQ